MEAEEIDATIRKTGKGVVYLGEQLWENPFGKAFIVCGCGLLAMGMLGIGFKVGAFTMNQYKDFKHAYKR